RQRVIVQTLHATAGSFRCRSFDAEEKVWRGEQPCEAGLQTLVEIVRFVGSGVNDTQNGARLPLIERPPIQEPAVLFDELSCARGMKCLRRSWRARHDLRASIGSQDLN